MSKNKPNLNLNSTKSFISKNLIGSGGPILVFILMVVIALNIFFQPNFFQRTMLRNSINSLGPYILLAMAQGIILIVGGLDLSIGAAASLTNCVLAAIMVPGSPVTGIYALLLALVICLAMGLINGFLIGVLRLDCVVITFATMFVWQGIALLFMPLPGGYVHSWFRGFYNLERVENLPGFLEPIAPYFPPVIALIAVGGLIWWIITKTKLGRYIYATGGNEEASYTTGLRPGLVIIGAHLIAYLLVFLAGVFFTAQNMSGDAYLAQEMTLMTVAGAVLGTAMIGGGVGKLSLVFVGMIILQMTIQVMLFAGIPSIYHAFIQGLLIVLVTALMIYVKDQKALN